MTDRIARTVVLVALLLVATVLPGTAEDRAATGRVSAGAVASSGPSGTAHQKYKWGRFRFDYAFEYGESLQDPPYRGTATRGRWLDTSTGSGRAAQYNGGLMLASRYGLKDKDGLAGDQGTTTATLKGAPQRTGRWELRFRPWVDERGGAAYRVRFELVPEDPAQRDCRASILAAEFTPEGRRVRFALTSPRTRRAWRGTHRVGRIENVANAFAVEVGRKHISWLVNGRTVGTARRTTDFPKVPLTVRLSLVGQPGREMTKTNAIVDWIRSWPLNQGKQVKKGPRMRSGRISGC